MSKESPETPAPATLSKENPFLRKSDRREKMDKLIRFSLWSATWSILLVASLIFGTIAWRGIPVLWKYGSDFWTKSPEALTVIELPSGGQLQAYSSSLEELKRYNPKLSLRDEEVFTRPLAKTSFILQQGTHSLPLDAVRLLEEATSTRFEFSNITHHDFGPQIEFTTHSQKIAILPTSDYDTWRRKAPTLPIEKIETFDQPETLVRFSIPENTKLEIPSSLAFELREINLKTLSSLYEETHSYSAGGILGPLVGTALLVIVCMIVALFIGISASIYLTEYARRGSLINAVRLAILNLSGVPSIVFGLFGLMLFVLLAPKLTDQVAARNAFRIPVFPALSEPSVREQLEQNILVSKGTPIKEAIQIGNTTQAKKIWNGRWYLSFEGWGACILAGGCTLALMVLPVIVTACEESLRAVPQGYREASLALGATKWQSTRSAVLPYAFPGILTASVLGITRVAGETAPIMFTAALAERSLLPWQGLNSYGLGWFFDFLSQSIQALPYHIYTVTQKIPKSEYTRPMQDGAVLVFMIFVMSFAGISVLLRMRMRRKLKW